MIGTTYCFDDSCLGLREIESREPAPTRERRLGIQAWDATLKCGHTTRYIGLPE